MTNEKDLRAFGKLTCRIARGEMMTREESRDAYTQVILDMQPELQQGAFLMAHITRGPSVEELAGAWEAIDLHDTSKIECSIKGKVCDIVGTGSDPLKTVNCSTPAALIAASCGLPVAKKGARLVTGVSGASDILEALGIDLSAPLSVAENCLNTNGICYLPGESFLKSGWARLIKSMRFTSAFNIVGPLTRPCSQTNCIVIGGYSPGGCCQLVSILRDIGMPSALAPFGTADGFDKSLGMDEFSPCGPTKVVQLRNSQIESYEISPNDFGMSQIPFQSIASSQTAAENASRVKKALTSDFDSPEGDFFCMNAAAALFISEYAKSYSRGYDMAKQALHKGKAHEKLLSLLGR
ncbi:MAG: anthranilate phosphoribosyltransferase [Victivallales bacterium]|nr:anthranilate phosphoribosyltransferase [Victivallales bacterium]